MFQIVLRRFRFFFNTVVFLIFQKRTIRIRTAYRLFRISYDSVSHFFFFYEQYTRRSSRRGHNVNGASDLDVVSFLVSDASLKRRRVNTRVG